MPFSDLFLEENSGKDQHQKGIGIGKRHCFADRRLGDGQIIEYHRDKTNDCPADQADPVDAFDGNFAPAHDQENKDGAENIAEKDHLKKDEKAPEKKTSENETPAAPEKKLTFDRAQDAQKKAPAEKNEPAEKENAAVKSAPSKQAETTLPAEETPAMTLDLLKVWGLFGVCALSLFLLLRRLFGRPRSA